MMALLLWFMYTYFDEQSLSQAALVFELLYPNAIALDIDRNTGVITLAESVERESEERIDVSMSFYSQKHVIWMKMARPGMCDECVLRRMPCRAMSHRGIQWTVPQYVMKVCPKQPFDVNFKQHKENWILPS